MTGWPGEALDAADELLVCKTVARGHLERAAERVGVPIPHIAAAAAY